MTRVLHVSDLHFGRPSVPEQIEAIETLIQAEKFDVVAISGDLTQRARAGEFQRARVFIRDAERVSKVVVIPGNHDVIWWKSPFDTGDDAKMYDEYRTWITGEMEPCLRVPGAVFVGINTSQGVTHRALTWRLKDLSVIGAVRREQLERAAREFATAAPGDARVIVMHHNPVKGELSGRHGLKDTKKILGAFAELGVDLVLCGHDHQEAVHYIEHTKKGTVIATAGTVSNRQRGGRPSSLNVVKLETGTIDVHTYVWDNGPKSFVPGPARCFAR